MYNYTGRYAKNHGFLRRQERTLVTVVASTHSRGPGNWGWQ